ncbi:hypothetical protein ACO0LM_20335 [Undibacterium sp. Di26W]|uniref:hypothetical protein n=1 Tax=Undibacterium sp. Di26W TaxID=3413035 RepID=UPI003BF23917
MLTYLLSDDPDKLGAALLAISKLPAPPLHFAAGSDAIALLRDNAEKTPLGTGTMECAVHIDRWVF